MRKLEQDKFPELWGGIECTINRVQDRFFDQLHYSGHYSRDGDVAQLAETGIKKIRYPILWEKHQPQKDSAIDWTWTAARLGDWQSRNVEVIAGLVHHGSGPAFTNLLDDDFPYLLASYAEKLIRQFPWLNYFTPVNEPLTTARFSGLYRLWYPHHADDHSFLKMLLNELKAVVLSMQAIRKVNPSAKLVQTEDLGKTYSTKLLRYQANFENKRRWLPYDLLCGKVDRNHPLWRYLLKHRITEKELAFFQDHPCEPDIFGFNHYLTSERFLDENLHRYPAHTHGGNKRHRYADVEAVRVELNEASGLELLLAEAWQRYQKPIAVTEVHLHCHREDQLRWFRQVWDCCQKLSDSGIQIEAITAWAMLGSFGWNKLLTQPGGDYEPGVFDVRNGSPRPTALAGFLKNINLPAEKKGLPAGEGWWQRPNRFFHSSLIAGENYHRPAEGSAPLLIIGKRGTLGRAFATVCRQRGLPFHLLGREECNIVDAGSIVAVIEKYRPWAIINAAGFVRVDDAEQETEACFAGNSTGPQNLALAAARYGLQLVSFSSDLVFDGAKGSPYLESDEPNPLNSYGRAKAEAEGILAKLYPAALVIRTSAFFGPWDEYNFAHLVQRSLQNEEWIAVASDAIISPTYVPDLVHATLDLLVDEEKGIWHLANQGELSWADFANELADRFELNRAFLQPQPTSWFNFAARRPLYSVLSSNRGLLLPSLDNAVKRYVEEVRTKCYQEQRPRVRA